MTRSPCVAALAVVVYCAASSYFAKHTVAPTVLANPPARAQPLQVRSALSPSSPQAIATSIEQFGRPNVIERWLIRRTETGWTAERIVSPPAPQAAPLAPRRDEES